MQAEIRLQQGIAKLGLNVTVEMQEKLIAYLQLMLKWNKAYNLTAIRELDSMVIRHVLDSLSILPFIKQSPVLDVGTGAGLPGIPLALCLPDYQFVLLDSNGKKTRFLTQAKIELGIENIEVIHSRIEDYKPGVRWLWLGALIMALGGALSVIDKRYRGKGVSEQETANVAT